MTFGQALAEMRKGKEVKLYDNVYRLYYDKIFDNVDGVYSLCPYIECKDLLSDDWEIVE